jgi:hypothetical protein
MMAAKRPPPLITDEQDAMDILWLYTKRYRGELELEKVFQGWKVRVLCANKRGKSGEAHGQNPREAATKLCREFGLVR